MTHSWIPTAACRRLVAAAALVIGLVAGLPAPAHAQKVAVFVNGEPITVLDVDQRIKLTEVSTHKAPSRQEALDELINEKLKVQIGKRYGVEIPDKEVDNTFNAMARRAGQSPQQFANALGQAGISVPSLKRRIRADITWSSIMRGKFPSILNVGEKDVLSALEQRKDGKDAVLFQYTLRPVLFILPRGSAPALIEARKREAEGLRNRFTDCDEGIRFARALNDVAVRDPIIRSSTDFAAQQREVLDATAIGRLTAPEVTPQGIEMFAVCAKEPGKGDTVGMAQVREAMVTERYNVQAKRYLDQLRREAIIETPR
jgi:peptidyl-prolyl cis-trans isomerase SurA